MLYAARRFAASLLPFGMLILFPRFSLAQAKISLNTLKNGYEAVVLEENGANRREVHLYSMQDKFRCESPTSSGRPNKIQNFIELYNASDAPVVWWYIDKENFARISPDSVKTRLQEEREKYGDAVVRKKYSISTTAMFITMKLIPRPAMMLMRQSELTGKWKAAGKARIAGYLCSVREKDYVYPLGERATSKAWVEEESGLVLRYEQRNTAQKGSLSPPQTSAIFVKWIRPLSVAKAAKLFRLPPGIIAYIPEMFHDVKVPADVKRRPLVDNDPTIVKTGMGFH